MFLLNEFITEQERLSALEHTNALSWTEGRQHSGYLKANLMGHKASVWFILLRRSLSRLSLVVGDLLDHDAYLIKYPVGSSIPTHVDPAPSATVGHVRLNCLLTEGVGGTLFVNDAPIPLRVRHAYMFRPDTEPHRVSVVERGERIVWSVGATFLNDAPNTY